MEAKARPFDGTHGGIQVGARKGERRARKEKANLKTKEKVLVRRVARENRARKEKVGKEREERKRAAEPEPGQRRTKLRGPLQQYSSLKPRSDRMVKSWKLH